MGEAGVTHRGIPAIVILRMDCSGELPQEIREAFAADLKRRGAECVETTGCTRRTGFRDRRLLPAGGWRGCRIDNAFEKRITEFLGLGCGLRARKRKSLNRIRGDSSRD